MTVLAGVGLAAAAVLGGLGLRALLVPHVRVDTAMAAAVEQGKAAPGYTIEQAISDRAQQTTIAFDALGFLTGSLGTDSFFPPGKVADFWGFQYLRDNDPSEMGHNTDFLTKASLNMYGVLSTAQRQTLTELAKGQVASINEYGYKRFVLTAAFRRLLKGDLPAGTTALDQAAVKAYSAALYQLDGEISYERAEVMGSVLSSLSDEQRASLDDMVGKGMLEWPDATEPEDMRSLSRDEKVAVMTYSGDMFSWYAGSVAADVYFCPERHGTYFGSFYLKDGPAVGNSGYNIATTVTGDMGERFIAALDAQQAALVNGLVEAQREDLLGIVDVRRSVAEKLRGFMAGDQVDEAAVMSLMEHYGELDGDIVYRYATAFSAVGKTLTASQTTQLMALRKEMLGDLSPDGAFLYSQAIPMPATPDTDFLFAKGKTTAQTTTISPSSALRGATVTIGGTRFGAKRSTGTVRFGATKCTRYLSWSAMRIRCKVPAAAAFGALTVTVRSAKGTSASTSFTVAEPEPTPTPRDGAVHAYEQRLHGRRHAARRLHRRRGRPQSAPRVDGRTGGYRRVCGHDDHTGAGRPEVELGPLRHSGRRDGAGGEHRGCRHRRPEQRRSRAAVLPTHVKRPRAQDLHVYGLRALGGSDVQCAGRSGQRGGSYQRHQRADSRKQPAERDLHPPRSPLTGSIRRPAPCRPADAAHVLTATVPYVGIAASPEAGAACSRGPRLKPAAYLTVSDLLPTSTWSCPAWSVA